MEKINITKAEADFKKRLQNAFACVELAVLSFDQKEYVMGVRYMAKATALLDIAVEDFQKVLAGVELAEGLREKYMCDIRAVTDLAEEFGPRIKALFK